ncbi:hypothetical protein GCM10027345_31900 [Hymenobacter daeguensis]
MTWYWLGLVAVPAYSYVMSEPNAWEAEATEMALPQQKRAARMRNRKDERIRQLERRETKARLPVAPPRLAKIFITSQKPTGIGGYLPAAGAGVAELLSRI